MKAVAASSLAPGHFPPTPASTPVKATKRSITEAAEGAEGTPSKRSRPVYDGDSDNDGATGKRSRRPSFDELEYTPPSRTHTRRPSIQSVRPQTPSRRPTFRRLLVPPKFSIAYKAPPTFELSTSPSPPASPVRSHRVLKRRAFSNPSSHKPVIPVPDYGLSPRHNTTVTDNLPATPHRAKSHKSLHNSPPISPSEWTRVAESVLRQVDWEEVASYVAGKSVK